MFNFLSKLLKKEPEVKELSLQQSQTLLETREKTAGTAFTAYAYPKFSEITYTIQQLQKQAELLQDINVEEQEGHAKLRKIVESNKKGFLQNMILSVKKLNPPKNENQEQAVEYALHARTQLTHDVQKFWKNIAITNSLLKEEMKPLTASMQELENQLKELEEYAHAQRFAGIQELKELLKELDEKKHKNKVAQDLLEVTALKVQDVEKEKIKLQNAREELEESSGAKRLKEIDARVELLKKEKKLISNELVQTLQPIDKLLQRMIKLHETKKFPLEEEDAHFIGILQSNAMQAIQIDTHGKHMKKIFNEALQAMEKNVLTGKGIENKKQELKQLIALDFFEMFFWKINAKDSELTTLEKELKALPLQEQRNQLQQQWNDKAHELEARGNEGIELKARKEKLEKEFNAGKETFSTLAQTVFQEHMVLKEVLL